MINTLTKEGIGKYTEKMFTDSGYSCLLEYTKSLITFYLKKKNYPFRIGIVFGIPMMNYSQTIDNKEMLHERIKSYMNILGVKELRVKKGNQEIIFAFGGKNDS